MVLEQLINPTWLQRRPFYAVFLGIAYTFIASITSYFLFRDNFSISLLFLITLLLVPSLMNLLSIEEEREQKEGLRHFFHNHRDIFEVYFFLSLGVFVGYLIIIAFIGVTGTSIDLTLGEQLKILGGGITENQIEGFSASQLYHALKIFAANVGVAVIFFILSFFYGAGSIFLVVWNTSIFSAFIFTTLRNISQGVKHSIALLGAFSIYMIPEIAGFLLAAIAGGVVSKAAMKESFLSTPFRNVLRDAFVLLILSFVILFLAAFFEAYIGVGLIKGLV